MKRRTVLFFLIAALLAFAVHAADTVNIHVDEVGMSLDIPTDYEVFTRNMSADDPLLAEKGIDIDQLQQLMEERSIYLDLMNEDPAFEIFVTMQPNTVKGMSVFDEDMLEQLKELLTQEYEVNGMTVDSVDYMTTDQTVFFRTEGSIETARAVIYYTVYDYQAISLVLRYEGDAMPEEYKTMMQSLVDSIRFDAAAAPDDDVAETEPEADAEAGIEAEEEAAAEEAADEIEAAAEELEDAAAETEALVTAAEEAKEESEHPAKKKGVPVLPIALGAAAVGAVVGICVSRSKKKRARQPTYAVPVAPAASVSPAAPVPPAAAAAVAGAAAPIAQAGPPDAPSAAPAGPAAPAPAAAPAVPAAPAAPAKRVCAACGADLGPGEQFCPYCGTKAE